MKRPFVSHLKQVLLEETRFIQVILGPRHFIYENADSVFSSKPEWLRTKWLEARLMKKNNTKVILIIDEVQSITNWSLQNYLQHSIVEPVITKDILQNATVKKPSLFRQTFELACLHAGEVLSLNKFLGQLQEGGNVDLVKHYLKLYEQAYLLKTLEKFSTNKIQKKGSSPKLIPRANAFLSMFEDVPRGRKF